MFPSLVPLNSILFLWQSYALSHFSILYLVKLYIKCEFLRLPINVNWNMSRHRKAFLWNSSSQFLQAFENLFSFFVCFFFSFIFISWRLITLQYCSGFCHTLTWISHGLTCVLLPDPPSHLPPHPIPLGLPSAPALSICLMHPTWAGDLFHPR